MEEMKSRIIEQIEDGRLDSSDLENLFQDIKDNFNEEEQTELYNLFISELKEKLQGQELNEAESYEVVMAIRNNMSTYGELSESQIDEIFATNDFNIETILTEEETLEEEQTEEETLEEEQTEEQFREEEIEKINNEISELENKLNINSDDISDLLIIENVTKNRIEEIEKLIETLREKQEKNEKISQKYENKTEEELEERLVELKEDTPLNNGNALRIQERLEIECLIAKRTLNIDVDITKEKYENMTEEELEERLAELKENIPQNEHALRIQERLEIECLLAKRTLNIDVIIPVDKEELDKEIERLEQEKNEQIENLNELEELQEIEEKISELKNTLNKSSLTKYENMTDKELEERLAELKEDTPLNKFNALKIQERLEIECLLAKRTLNIDVDITKEKYENMTDKELEERLTELKENIPQNGHALKIQERLEIECLLEKRTLNIDVMTPFKLEEIAKEIEKLEAEKEEKIGKFSCYKDIQRLKELKEIRDAYNQIKEEGFTKFDEEELTKEEIETKVNEFVDNHSLVKTLDKYENSDKLKDELKQAIKNSIKLKKENTKPVEKKEQNKKLLYKGLAAVAGFATGLGLSCVPGVGTIRMGISVTKLAVSGINFWAKKHPEGKIAKLRNTTIEKINKIPGAPKVIEKVNKMREKLKSSPWNCFINGVAAGYITGNLIEMFTGETILEHLQGDSKEIEIDNPIKDTGDTGNNVPDNNVPDNNVPTDEIINNSVPTIDPSTLTLNQGEVIDLSSLAKGSVSPGGAMVNVMEDTVGKTAVFDKISVAPDGKIWWHFKQLNGAGYAWFPAEDVQEVLAKAASVGSKTL